MKKRIIIIFTSIAVLFLLFLCVPVAHFEEPYSTVVTAKDGRLIGARIAEDGQWRFPATNSYSQKYLRCVLTFEDKYFYYHPGFNPISFFKALIDNIKAGEVVRGGSTISMQVVRLSRENKARTLKEKIIEVIMALRLELRYSKDEIFGLYAAHAPFGGNVVGIDAAAWRYFNTSPDRLTWSEAATLAVLPNSPSLVNPSKGRDILKKKRDRLLANIIETKIYLPERHRDKSVFTNDDYELSLIEDIPPRPYKLPMMAYHYVADIEKDRKGEFVVSNIDYSLQQSVNEVVGKYHNINAANGIENLCVYVIDYQTDKIVAYVGNYLEAKESAMVDMIKAQRSTGSILKPYLYAACLDDGLLFPTMILPDIPVNLSGYTPQNYSGEFYGAVAAKDALSKSLNTPFVHLLRKYSLPKFHALLKQLRLSGIVFPPEHYGFSLILGGAEASLFDIVNAYGKMGHKLKYDDYEQDSKNDIVIPFSKTAIWLTFDAMQNLNRPNNQLGWRYFASTKKVAWKTGTSFGFKDAWAVGLTDRYVVGVWCGNADGEGRPGLTGINVAAPVMFEVFSYIDDSYHDADAPDDAAEVEVCADSGYPKSDLCPKTFKIKVPKTEAMTGVCPYHKKVFLDESRQYQVVAGCYSIDPDCFEIYYSLPPVMEWFYRRHNPLYRSLPPLFSGCSASPDEAPLSFIYPEDKASVIIPLGIKDDRQAIIFEIAHRNPNKMIFWTLDDKFLGKTKIIHQMPIDVKDGEHQLRCVDEDGNEVMRKFIVKNSNATSK